MVVTGRGETRRWTDSDGKERQSKGILADAIGPDLRWVTAQMRRPDRHQSTSEDPEGQEEEEEPF